MQEYDIALKHLLQGSAEWALRELTGVAVSRWLNVEMPEVRGTRVDLVGESETGELVHIELQSTNDPKMALRSFGALPAWAAEKLAARSTAEMEELSTRLLDAGSIEELLQ